MDNSGDIQDVMLEFRAGKMFLEGTRVVPDTRKGLVRIGRGEEGLLHFQWLDRVQNVVEDDQIIFPDEAIFEKVTQTSDRVYILKFNTDDRRFFFWMQEPRADDDVQICYSVNSYINQPFGEDEAEASVPIHMSADSEDTANDDLSSRAGNLVDQSLGADLTGEVTSSATGPVRIEDLRRILSSIQPTALASDPDYGLNLADILKPDLVLPLINTLPVEQQLAQYLPEGSQTTADIIELFQSPPFRQQVDKFNEVLKTGSIDLSQFGMDPSKFGFGVIPFLEALEESVGRTPEESEDPQCQIPNDAADPMDES